MEKVLLPRGYGRSYDACKHAIEHDCDIVAPDRSGVIALEYIIKDICKDFDSLEIDRITFSDYIDSVIINHHKFNGAVEAIEIRLYDICQYFEHEKTERGRRKMSYLMILTGACKSCVNTVKSAWLQWKLRDE
jgi:hypothetical protein|nr:MAG TPA: hypothetical protein [Caudoviricetes sp.]